MRIWNLPCSELDNQHLLGEHAELHGLWTTISQNRKGFANHPETQRWRGRLGALYLRHEEQVAEMARRGYLGHKSPLDESLVGDDSSDPPPVTADEVERDRRELVEHFPGWRKAAAAASATDAPETPANGSE